MDRTPGLLLVADEEMCFRGMYEPIIRSEILHRIGNGQGAYIMGSNTAYRLVQ
jgi:hypothetical protein